MPATPSGDSQEGVVHLTFKAPRSFANRLRILSELVKMPEETVLRCVLRLGLEKVAADIAAGSRPTLH